MMNQELRTWHEQHIVTPEDPWVSDNTTELYEQKKTTSLVNP